MHASLFHSQADTNVFNRHADFESVILNRTSEENSVMVKLLDL